VNGGAVGWSIGVARRGTVRRENETRGGQNKHLLPMEVQRSAPRRKKKQDCMAEGSCNFFWGAICLVWEGGKRRGNKAGRKGEKWLLAHLMGKKGSPKE